MTRTVWQRDDLEPIDESTVDGKLTRLMGWVGVTPGGMMVHENGNQQQREFRPSRNLHDLREVYLLLTGSQRGVYEKLVVDHDLSNVFTCQAEHAELILRAFEVQS